MKFHYYELGLSYLVNYHSNRDEEEGGIMTVYDEELNVVKTIRLNDYPDHLRVYDFDDNPYDYDLVASQSLFNDDEKFEYVTSPGSHSDSDTKSQEINIVSADGTVLQSLTVPANRGGLDIVIVGNNRYLSIVPNEDDGIRYMYKINKSANPSEVSISTVPVKMKVSPRIADRNQDITVSVEGEGSREVFVTDAAGKVVYTTKAKAGQNTVTFSSHHFYQMRNTETYHVLIPPRHVKEMPVVIDKVPPHPWQHFHMSTFLPDFIHNVFLSHIPLFN